MFFLGGQAAWLGEVFQTYFILALRRAKGWIGVASLMASQEVRSTQMFWGHLRFSCPPSHSRCEMTIGCSCDKTSVTNYGIYMYLRELMCFLSEPTWKFGRVWQHWSCCKCFLLCGFFFPFVTWQSQCFIALLETFRFDVPYNKYHLEARHDYKVWVWRWQ